MLGKVEFRRLFGSVSAEQFARHAAWPRHGEAFLLCDSSMVDANVAILGGMLGALYRASKYLSPFPIDEICLASRYSIVFFISGVRTISVV